jgi:hypothetical protein
MEKTKISWWRRSRRERLLAIGDPVLIWWDSLHDIDGHRAHGPGQGGSRLRVSGLAKNHLCIRVGWAAAWMALGVHRVLGHQPAIRCLVRSLPPLAHRKRNDLALREHRGYRAFRPF